MLTGHFAQVDMYHLHRNPEEWTEPEKFVIERFDPESPWYQTPSGGKRHPLSFGPFAGGRRACIGRALGEQMAKLLLAMTIWQYDFEFAEEKHKARRPNFDITLDNPPIPVRITKRTHE